MSCRVVYISLLALSLTACGSINNKNALGDFDYQHKSEANQLVIPANLDQPDLSKDFFITDKINNQGPIGEDMDIRAPSLVMPVASSSRVVDESAMAIIWFDKVLEEQDLLALIEQAILETLAKDGIGHTYIEEDVEVTLGKVIEGSTSLKETSINREGIKTAIIESDWYHSEVEEGWIFTEITLSTSIRYRFQILAKAHGRSVSLRVSKVDFLQTDENGGSNTMDPIDQIRAEKAMLNHLIATVDYKYRVKQRDNRLERANQKLVTIGKNTLEESSYLIELGLDDLWNNLPLFFEKHGFTITDLNEERKIYYVDFVQPDASIWDTIWGDAAPVIDVLDAHYQFVLDPLDDVNHKTAVTIYRADGTPLGAEVLERIFPVVEKGLSFKEIF